MTVAQGTTSNRNRAGVAELDEARGDVRRHRADLLDDVHVCSSCRDPEAAPRAAVHPSGNPWLSKLVCTSCGAPWTAERVHRGRRTVIADAEESRT
jgi:hypothetical protein